MAASASDADDDDTGHVPPPQDDRLWRHPSELGPAQAALSFDPVTNRRHWLQNEPSRASAWTAGIVGALLATGLVVLGTHLATAITSPPLDGSPSAVKAITASTLGASVAPEGGLQGIGATLLGRIKTLGASIATIDVARAGSQWQCLGLVVRPDGMLVAPAASLAGATSLLVYLPDGVPYVGTVVGSDPDSGLAVIHINGVRKLPFVSLGPTSVGRGAMTLAITGSGGARFSLGTVDATDVDPAVGNAALVDGIVTDIPSATSPEGSVLVGDTGSVVGIITATTETSSVATPAWLAKGVVNELIARGKVVHGWLGMVSGKTEGTRGSTGVLVQDVASHSAASRGGLAPGDVIVSIDGRNVTTLSALRGRLYVLAPSTKVRVGVVKNDRRRTLVVVLGSNKPS